MANQIASLVVALEANTVKLDSGFNRSIKTMQDSQRALQAVGSDLKALEASLAKTEENFNRLCGAAQGVTAIFARSPDLVPYSSKCLCAIIANFVFGPSIPKGRSNSYPDW